MAFYVEKKFGNEPEVESFADLMAQAFQSDY